MKHTLLSMLIAFVLTSCTMDSFLFNAEPLASYTLSSRVIPDTSRVEVSLSSDGETIYGYFVKQPDSMRVAPHPTIIYHHGNKDNLQFYWDRVELLYQAGFDIFIYDYRGYGKSTGKSSEAGLMADARAALTYVLGRKGIDSAQIVHYGFSLGGFPALFSATKLYRPKALITESIFASGESLVQSGTLLNIPGSYVLDGAFDNVVPMQSRTCPVLMLHGTNDTFIGVEPNGQRLYDIARQPKTFIRIEGAEHDNVPYVLGTQNYIDLITAFIRGN
ncbi:MAG: alpha/beta hydrolase [Candidatus Kapabacteria bacterium]|nr:alpha/beta hydrolase [Candidatus Kapabacteria bacterium]